MNGLDLDAIRARCDAATPGPWTYDEAGYVDIGLPRSRSIAVGVEIGATAKSDGGFIAHARADVPALLAHIEELAERTLTAEERLEQRTRERDEARAQLAATDTGADTGAPCDGHRHCCADRRRLADELIRVRAERDVLKEKP